MRIARLVCLPVLLAGCVYTFEPPRTDLFPGDVTGVAVGVPPGSADGAKPLEGSRIRVRASAISRITGGDGVFVVRNLPVGDHVLLFTWDPGQDGTPDLAARVTVPVRIPASRTERPSIDLGRVELLRAASIVGRVTGFTNASAVRVALPGYEVVVPIDDEGRFTINGLGAGEWEVVAGGPGSISNVVRTNVAPGETVDVGTLTLVPSTQQGAAQVTITFPPDAPAESITQALEIAPTQVRFWPLTSDEATVLPVEAPTALQFSLQLPVGLYALQVRFPEDVVPLEHGAVAILPETATTVDVIATPVTGCVDIDGDRMCHLARGESGSCEATCHSLDAPASCTEGGKTWDCDDDGDGEPDPVEYAGDPNDPATRGPCECGFVGPVQGEGTCDLDPARYDLDFDDVCDLWDPHPNCPEPCGEPPRDGGVDAGPELDASVPDSGRDAAVPDAAGLDAAVVDAAQPDAATPDAAPTLDAAVNGADAGELRIEPAQARIRFDEGYSFRIVAPPGVDLDAGVTWNVTAALDPLHVFVDNASSSSVTVQAGHRPTDVTVAATILSTSQTISASLAIRAPNVSERDVVDVAVDGTDGVLVLDGGWVWQYEVEPGTQGPLPVYDETGRGTLRNPVKVRQCAGYAMALMPDGRVLTWGAQSFYGGNGQPGFLSADAGRWIPEPVWADDAGTPLRDVVDIDCSSAESSAALIDGGTLLTWGRDIEGDLGHGVPTSGSINPVPAPVLTGDPAQGGVPLANVKQFSQGDIFSGAIVDNQGTNEVWIWGRGQGFADFQLNGGNGPYAHRVDLTPVPGFTPVAISAGGSNYVMLGADGSMAGWGYITSFPSNQRYPSQIQRITNQAGQPITGVSRVWGASNTIFFQMQDGQVMAIGEDNNGTLLDVGGSTYVEQPTPVVMPPVRVADHKDGVGLGLAFDGRAWSWGAPLRGMPVVATAVRFGFSLCGNGVVDLYDFCDDGNFAGGDGCSASCGEDFNCVLNEPPGTSSYANPSPLPAGPTCGSWTVYAPIDPDADTGFYRVTLPAGVQLSAKSDNCFTDAAPVIYAYPAGGPEPTAACDQEPTALACTDTCDALRLDVPAAGEYVLKMTAGSADLNAGTYRLYVSTASP
ncbi:MAG: hypothetical protein AB2A00_01160 [Myxococcota bacterium]